MICYKRWEDILFNKSLLMNLANDVDCLRKVMFIKC
ncbi:Uncharacterized protein TCM_027129 [Theobroma cacao]|uniref:Uncharacterized protein n=1 Tax=Theobroma cacao TaxID=3641 RepID=A0A061G8L9_THECC|nr:Uncharacterized protein TCM_027129 [Theobroma cacao]